MSAPAQSNNATPSTTNAAQQQEPFPQAVTLLQAAKLSMMQDKPIMLDYYKDSAKNTAFIGVDKTTGKKILIKSNDEFTSLVTNMYKVNDDVLVLTENSIYIISGLVKKKDVNVTQLFEMMEDME
jgi:hypothetical protein